MLAELVATLLCLGALLSHGESRPEKVIINTDPGIDDSMAIFLALASPELEVIGVTINFGSLHDVQVLGLNALRVLEAANRTDIPVYIGSQDPIGSDFHDLGGPLFHGEDGLGNTYMPLPHGQFNTTLTAAEFIVESARNAPGEVSILSLAPVPNIAIALQLEPRLPQLINRISMMGGTIVEAGNVSPLAEANIANDPHSASKVFGAGFNLLVAGLDVTMYILQPPDFLDSLRDTTCGSFLSQIFPFYFKAYAGLGLTSIPTHDPTALVAMVRPDLFRIRSYPTSVGVSAYPNPTHGMVIADRRPPMPYEKREEATAPQFLMEVDGPKVVAFMKERLHRLP